MQHNQKARIQVGYSWCYTSLVDVVGITVVVGVIVVVAFFVAFVVDVLQYTHSAFISLHCVEVM